MTIKEAEEICDQIQSLAADIEDDYELKLSEPRYSIMAQWIDTDIECVSLE